MRVVYSDTQAAPTGRAEPCRDLGNAPAPLTGGRECFREAASLGRTLWGSHSDAFTLSSELKSYHIWRIRLKAVAFKPLGDFFKLQMPRLNLWGEAEVCAFRLQVILTAPKVRTTDLQGLTQVTASTAWPNTSRITSNPYPQLCPAFSVGAICIHCMCTKERAIQPFVCWVGRH